MLYLPHHKSKIYYNYYINIAIFTTIIIIIIIILYYYINHEKLWLTLLKSAHLFA